jgi:signal transduction histidine kinase
VAAAARVDLMVEQPARAVPLRGNREQLERAVGNLVSNAIKFTGAGGHVRLSSSVDEDTVQIECTDTGIGIPEADLSRIFTRFYRATNAQESQVQGTGLGLAIVRTIAEAHGGTVELSSQEGMGTTVTMRLPSS